MKTIDVLGKPCPVPVIETKKVLTDPAEYGVLVKVDSIVAVQNLEKMSKGSGYGFSFTENAKDSYEVVISKGAHNPSAPKTERSISQAMGNSEQPKGLTVVIGRDTMGEGAEELGKILIKGFIYSLTELTTPPEHMVFFNSGAFLTTAGANTVNDLKKLSEKGTKVLTCGACVNHYEIADKLAVGEITNMYRIAEIMAFADKVINI